MRADDVRGLNKNIRIYKYMGGDVFGQHVDGSNQTDRGKTEFTLLIYLSGEDISGQQAQLAVLFELAVFGSSVKF